VGIHGVFPFGPHTYRCISLYHQNMHYTRKGRPWKWRRYVPPKRRLQLNRLHGVTSQKMTLFITTAVKTSNALYTSPKRYCGVGTMMCGDSVTTAPQVWGGGPSPFSSNGSMSINISAAYFSFLFRTHRYSIQCLHLFVIYCCNYITLGG
jgi:hypothetical protein